MSWHDRDYAQPEPLQWGRVPRRSSRFPIPLIGGSVVSTLIAVNIANFVLCTLTLGQIRIPVQPDEEMLTSGLFFWQAMNTPAVLHGQVWRLITAQFVHWSVSHLLMNMLGLHFLGRPLENDWGQRRFFGVYMVAGTIGMLFYTALTLVGWLPAIAFAAGASGGVLGLLGACAVRYPHATVYIYFLFPIKIRTAALFFGGWYVLNLYARGANAGGDACHLAGMLFGAWWAHRGDQWWERAVFSIRQWGCARRGNSYRSPRSTGPDVDQVKIDEILRKVYERGIHSLDESEKDLLRQATLRQRAAESGPRLL